MIADGSVAFGPSGLDRAAERRGGEGPGGPQARLVLGPEGLLVEGPEAAPRLAREAGPGDVLLGREGEGLVWARAAGGGEGPGEGRRWEDLRALMARLGPRDAELAATAKALLGWHASHGFCAACGTPSRPAQSGWRRDCPACGAQHFPRTDPVVIMLVTRGDRVLLGRSPGWPEGMVSLLAGFVEPGETVEAAVRREVREEAGVEVGAVAYLRSQPWPFPASLMLGCRGEALGEAITLDPLELDWAGWVSRARLFAMFEGRDPEWRAPRRGPIAGALLRDWLAGRVA